MKKAQTLDIPGNADKILLHTCCAPCSSAIIEFLMKNNITPVIYYCNSNIYPHEEYLKRKHECTRYSESLGLEIIDDDYNHEDWLAWIRGLESQPERGSRCAACFRYRLLRSARYAAERGISVLTTTLASSRWKSLEQINEAGIWACTAANESNAEGNQVIWWDRNWRKGGLQERRNQLIKENDFYNQLWCGCEFSLKQDK